ncbi:Flavoprotein [Prauserella aidingensis]|uniref:flavoprotein n=1 Tax=Prauserella aidingensis TaxID=387890 RepID=UPI0020A5A48E|nr:flavoprotein [Prauserella aidingensis]MCP2255701.1 Flavoprotein [Prauserella aidingensis]
MTAGAGPGTRVPPGTERGCLGLVASACGGVETRLTSELAEPAAARGWRLAITLTPTAASWFDDRALARLQATTDLDVRWTARTPGAARPHPDPEAFVFAPAGAGSVAKLALGLADNQALTVLGDAVGVVPMVVGHRVRPTRPAHPAWQGHLDALAGAGVRVTGLGDAPWTGVLDRLPHGDAR